MECHSHFAVVEHERAVRQRSPPYPHERLLSDDLAAEEPKLLRGRHSRLVRLLPRPLGHRHRLPLPSRTRQRVKPRELQYPILLDELAVTLSLQLLLLLVLDGQSEGRLGPVGEADDAAFDHKSTSCWSEAGEADRREGSGGEGGGAGVAGEFDAGRAGRRSMISVSPEARPS